MVCNFIFDCVTVKTENSCALLINSVKNDRFWLAFADTEFSSSKIRQFKWCLLQSLWFYKVALCCVVSHTKNELRSFIFGEDFVSVKKWSKFVLKKMALNARISNTRAVTDLCLLYYPPFYHYSIIFDH